MSTVEPIRSGVRLRVLEGATHNDVFRLERALVSIGRSTPETPASPCYLTFPEPTVSRLHAVLTWESGAQAYLLHHRSQTNPTVLNTTIMNGPTLLKIGDRITLGRLVLVLEADDSSSSLTTPAPHSLPALCLHARQSETQRIFSAPVREAILAVHFIPERATAAVPAAGDRPGWQEIRLPARSGATLHLAIDPSTETCRVELLGEGADGATRISLHRLGHRLEVPLRAGQQLHLLPDDLLLHQGYQLWLGHESRPPRALEGLEADRYHPLGRLHWRNGPWQGALLTLLPQGLPQRLGSGDLGFGHPSPWGATPSAELSWQAGRANLRALEVSDDQILEVDGDLVFASESVSLVGGSRVLLGEAEFLWSDGSESVYSSYQLHSDQAVYAIQKAVVRLGTAAHCEVKLPYRELAPVLGRLEFFPDGRAHYVHQDLAAPVRIDGNEVSVGLSVPVASGSLLELSSQRTLTLQQACSDSGTNSISC